MQNFRFPAEWEKQQSTWTAFPFDPYEWHDDLRAAQIEIAAFASTIAQHGQQVHLVCRDESIKSIAQEMIPASVHAMIDFPIIPYGDIWLRDTGPLTMVNGTKRYAQLFQFNGWGEKYLMEGDQKIGTLIADSQRLKMQKADWILEGGAIDTDGAGLAVTTKECLLNRNRNPQLTQSDIEGKLKTDLAINRILWLDHGLKADHTDGHVDNLARFIAPRHILIPKALDDNDPNKDIYEAAATKTLEYGLKLSRMPSVGYYEINSAIAPASYMNFYITNNIVIIPQFNVKSDPLAVQTMKEYFPDRKCIGLSSVALLSGGGSFHCASQQLAAI